MWLPPKPKLRRSGTKSAIYLVALRRGVAPTELLEGGVAGHGYGHVAPNGAKKPMAKVSLGYRGFSNSESIPWNGTFYPTPDYCYRNGICTGSFA